MKTALFLAATLLMAASILLSIVSDMQQSPLAVVKQQQQSSQFLHYVEALDNVLCAAMPTNGDVSDRVTLPAWLPQSSGIALRISGDIAYAFRPAVPGLFSQLLQDTENSTHFGLSDLTGITTPTGWQPRPAFIPVGYVVYLRENRC